jgi:predicted dehydrogenase
MTSSVVRFGIIGTGGMGQGHCNMLGRIAEAQLAAICDLDPDTAQRVGDEYGVPTFRKHKDLIKSGLVDAVIIATPHPVRPAIAIDCMRAGLHVLSEKPLAEKVSAADKMIAAANETGVAFAVMFQRRTEPALAKAISIVQSGALGRVFRRTMISPEYRSQAYYDSGTWRATWSGEGGGVSMNQSPHILDLFILLGGIPCEVYGRMEIKLHHIEVEDLAEGMLSYPDGGHGYLYCSTNEAGPGQMIEIFGDDGKLVYRNGELKLYRFEPSITEYTRTATGMWGGPTCTEVPIEIQEGECGHAVITRNFARHILTGEPLLTPGAQGLASLELANALWLSAAQGKAVKLPISRRAYDAFLEKKRKTSTFQKGDVHVQRVTDPNHVTK